MLKIENNTIYLTRGDTAVVGINITDAYNKPYYFSNYPTTIKLSVKHTTNDTSYVFQKTVVDKDVITINPADTQSLSYGLYTYDIQMECQGVVSTIIPPSKFYLCEEVTI